MKKENKKDGSKDAKEHKGLDDHIVKENPSKEKEEKPSSNEKVVEKYSSKEKKNGRFKSRESFKKISEKQQDSLLPTEFEEIHCARRSAIEKNSKFLKILYKKVI